MKSRDGKSQRREEEERRSKRESLRRKKIQVREKVGKSRNTVFQWFVAPEGRKVGSLKPRVRSQLARWEMKSCMPLWREARFQVKMYKTPQLRSTFRSWDVEKVHAVVVRSTLRSQNEQNTSCTNPFWKLRCRKCARRCGAKQISKSTSTKHASYLRKLFWGGSGLWNIFLIISNFNINFMLTSANKNHSKIIYAPVTRWWCKIIFHLQRLKHLGIILSKQPKAPQNTFSVELGKLFRRIPTV